MESNGKVLFSAPSDGEQSVYASVQEGERRGGEAQRVPGRDARGTAGGAGASGVGRAMDTSYGLLGLLGVIRMTDPDVTMLAVGTDLTTLGLNLNSTEYVCEKGTKKIAEVAL